MDDFCEINENIYIYKAPKKGLRKFVEKFCLHQIIRMQKIGGILVMDFGSS